VDRASRGQQPREVVQPRQQPRVDIVVIGIAPLVSPVIRALPLLAGRPAFLSDRFVIS